MASKRFKFSKLVRDNTSKKLQEEGVKVHLIKCNNIVL